MAVIQEAWVGGVSTRRVDDLVQAKAVTSHGASGDRSITITRDYGARVNGLDV